jgi:CAAX prenyl protease-like protein
VAYTLSVAHAGWRHHYPSLPYVVPFLALLTFVAGRPYSPLSPFVEWPLQVLVLAVLLVFCWPRELDKIPRHWLSSLAVGVAVFCTWIAPDYLVHGYRGSILFSNGLLGGAPHSSLPPAAQRSAWILAWRTARATVVVPIAEELFWRAWLMRWLVDHDFLSVRLGTFAPLAFFLTALLFASEHGSYWDVGLVTGLIYNLWMIRTKSVADCILMHGVTNGVLSAYVIATANWQYWM